jgi:hypothetical protein
MAKLSDCPGGECFRYDYELHTEVTVFQVYAGGADVGFQPEPGANGGVYRETFRRLVDDVLKRLADHCDPGCKCQGGQVYTPYPPGSLDDAPEVRMSIVDDSTGDRYEGSYRVRMQWYLGTCTPETSLRTEQRRREGVAV